MHFYQDLIVFGRRFFNLFDLKNFWWAVFCCHNCFHFKILSILGLLLLLRTAQKPKVSGAGRAFSPPRIPYHIYAAANISFVSTFTDLEAIADELNPLMMSHPEDHFKEEDRHGHENHRRGKLNGNAG